MTPTVFRLPTDEPAGSGGRAGIHGDSKRQSHQMRGFFLGPRFRYGHKSCWFLILPWIWPDFFGLCDTSLPILSFGDVNQRVDGYEGRDTEASRCRSALPGWRPIYPPFATDVADTRRIRHSSRLRTWWRHSRVKTDARRSVSATLP